MTIGTNLESNGPARIHAWDAPKQRPATRRAPSYQRILAPTDLSESDAPALRLGAELALAHGASLCVLLVTPKPANQIPVDGIDSVQLLHRAAQAASEPSAPADDEGASEYLASRVEALLEKAISPAVYDAIDVRTVHRQGDLADEIIAWSKESAADLLVLSLPPARWWLPLLPATLWKIQQRAQCQTIFVSPSRAERV